MLDISTSRLRIFLPSILDVFFLLLLFYIIFVDAGAHILKDADTGFHIMVGRFFLENGHVPTSDIYSFTVPGQQWVAFSWGTGVLFALMDKLMQLNGVVLLCLSLIMLTLFVIYKLLMKWEINFFIIALSMFLLTSLTSVHWLARPHLFTIVLTCLTFYFLELANENKKYYYPIPIIMMLWVNLHPGFISGFFLLILYFFGNLIESLITKDDALKKLFKQRLIAIGIVFVVSFLLTLVNPYGIESYYYIYDTLKSSWIVNITLEYLSPNFHGTYAVIVYEAVILAFIFLGLRGKNRVLDMPKILVFLLWAHLSLFAQRNIAIFAVIAVPCFALVLQDFLDSFNLEHFKQMSDRFLRAEKALKYHLWPIMLIVFVIFCSINNHSLVDKQVVNCHFSEKYLPVKALKYLEKAPLKGNMFNLDNWGGYIIYAYPEIKVFMDGRLDMYQEDFIGEYQKVVQVTPEWDSVLDKYKVDWVLISNSTLLKNMLGHSKSWEPYYTDDLASIYKRKQ